MIGDCSGENWETCVCFRCELKRTRLERDEARQIIWFRDDELWTRELEVRDAERERDEARKLAGKYWSRPSGFWGHEPEEDGKRYPWLQEAADVWWEEKL
jgi:hypothetical protein